MSANIGPKHTPYDGSSRPFTIGLKALETADFIEVDAHLQAYLDEKDRLAAEVRDQVIVSETGSEAAQEEVLVLVASHVCNAYPQTYRRDGTAVTIAVDGRKIDLADPAYPPIHRVARLVQEDLVLMRRGDAGWYLSAASVCFPSAWNLHEKFLRPMHEIHRPVPGFGQGTRNAGLIERMFDNVKPGVPVIRWNWSLYGDDRLFHPTSDNGMKRRFGDGAEPANINLRLERQTLQKLPVSGAILFTIRIHINPIEAMEKHPDAALLASSIIEQLTAMSLDEIDYKGLKDERERLVNRLSKAAGLPRG
jgi:dimethylamine monooxygenase subunit A